MRYLFQKISYLFLVFFTCCFLYSCGSQPDAESNTTPSTESNKDITTPPSTDKKEKTPEASNTSTPIPTISPVPTSVPRHHATIHDNLSKGLAIELDITMGDTVDVAKFAQLSGYDFIGCYDSQNKGGELYIDSHGVVCAEVVSDVTLYAWYSPKNYTLSFTCNGKNASLSGIQNINAAYDANIREFLPLNRIINETDLIYSVSYGGRKLTDITEDKPILLNESVFDVNTFTSTSNIVLDLKTVTVHQEKNFGLQEVCIKDDFNQFEQRFKDEYICDMISFDNIDFELLESLGYNNAVIEITCCMREKDDGNQEIYVYNNAYENNPSDTKKDKKEKVKNMEDFLLESKEHDCNEIDVEETTTFSINVSLSRLKSGTGIYVYYGASGWGDDDWYRVSTKIKVDFERRLDK